MEKVKKGPEKKVTRRGRSPSRSISRAYSPPAPSIGGLIPRRRTNDRARSVDRKNPTDETKTQEKEQKMKFFQRIQVQKYKGVDPTKRRSEVVDSLCDASSSGNLVEVVKYLDGQSRARINSITQEGEFALYSAAKNGQVAALKYLLQKNADIDQRNPRGENALFAACETGHLRIVEELITLKANINAPATIRGKKFPLYLAAMYGHSDCVKLLIEKNADIHQQDDKDLTSLFIASENGHSEVCRVLCEFKADVNLPNKLFYTPLIVAAQHGHSKACEVLLKYRANIQQESRTGMSSLLSAAYYDFPETVQVLLNNDACITETNKNGMFALGIAAINGHTRVVDCLLRNKANPNQISPDKTCPITMAARHGHADVLRLLVNTADPKQLKSARKEAMEEGHADCVAIIARHIGGIKAFKYMFVKSPKPKDTVH